MANQQKGGEKMDKQGGMYLFLKNKKKIWKQTYLLMMWGSQYSTSITTQMMGAWLVVGKEKLQ
jgi:hypothetical protein